MNEGRIRAACTVFEGRVVVSGGYGNNVFITNTVEAYDHVADEWTYMPNMIMGRESHGSVAMKNKLFVFGFGSAEVYDSTCDKFVALKKKPSTFKFNKTIYLQTFSIGSKFVTFGYNSSTALCYDVEKNEWSEEPFEATYDYDIGRYSCTLVPKMEL